MTGGVQLAILVQALACLQSSEPSLFWGSVWTQKQVVSPSSVLERQRRSVGASGHLCAYKMTNSDRETSSGDGEKSHMCYCGLLPWLSDDPVSIAGFLMNKDTHLPVQVSRGHFQVSNPVL